MNGTESPANTNRSMEEVCERENLKEALRRVKANKGSAGVDGRFLGFSFTAGPEVRRVIAPKALDRFKQRIQEITRRAKSVSMATTMAGR
jgi:hypothetical protein